jgi:hypothetical protein
LTEDAVNSINWQELSFMVMNSVWGMVVIVIIISAGFVSLRSCQEVTSLERDVAQTCIKSGGSWIPSSDSGGYQCVIIGGSKK